GHKGPNCDCCFPFLTGNRVKTDCTEFRSTSCLPCADGTYMENPTGKKQCNPCTICDKGSGLRLKIKCSRSSDTVCEALEGYFCIDFVKGSCDAAKKHSSCKPGQYISKAGTSLSDTECSECSRGTFSNGSLTLCQPHTQCKELNLQLVKEGTTSTDAECGEKNIYVAAAVGISVVLVVCVGIAVAVFVLWKKKMFIFGEQTLHQRNKGSNSTPRRTHILQDRVCPPSLAGTCPGPSEVLLTVYG
uniref:TNFR-Cys domain-containing protein n=1 Tax=Cyprinodon variegatus TaxID=28743 RepID=A0A3Q2E630_CYPVA